MTEEVKKLEVRLRRVEQELLELRRSINASETKLKRSWIDDIAGRFTGDPAFAEIVRLGKELRDAERPPKRRRTK